MAGLVGVEQNDLGGRAAHVERDRLRGADLFGNLLAENRAAGRARLHQSNGKAQRRIDRGQRAARHDHQQRSVKPHFGKSVDQITQILPHQRLHIGIGRRRRGPLIFADLRTDFMRDADRHPRTSRLDDRAGANFMIGIAVGVQKDDRHRCHVFVTQLSGEIMDGGFIERQQHVAVGVDPFRHFKAERTRHQGRRADHVQIVLIKTMPEGEFERVPEAGGGDECRTRSPAFDDGIGRERRSVNDEIDLLGPDAGLAEHLADAIDHPHLGGGAGRQNLPRGDAPRRFQHDIGEGSADIDRQPVPAHAILSAWDCSTKSRRLSSFRRAIARSQNARRCRVWVLSDRAVRPLPETRKSTRSIDLARAGDGTT